ANVGVPLAEHSAVVFKADTTTLSSQVVVATIGEGTLGNSTNPFDIHSGTFDNAYISWNGPGSNTGHLYVCGTGAANKIPTLYGIPFDGVSSVSLASGGQGYTSAPAVSFGSNATATATATITNSEVFSI